MGNNIITGKTKICALIGDPVEHSVSPLMHNAAYRKLGLDYLYLPFRVGKEHLAGAVDGMRALNFVGFNVTIPHKVAIISLLDELDDMAKKIAAVNTVVNKNSKLVGYNTDAAGFLQALLERNVDPVRKNVVVLGAGGASRAICSVLAEKQAHLLVLNRDSERARWLAEKIDGLTVLELNSGNLEKALSSADILVNATSVGMYPAVNETPVPSKLLKTGLTVFDIVYNPVKTRLLQEAEVAGARAITGIDMLAWQGALAFEKFTGQPAPFTLMKKEAIKAMGNI
jgi:shikimate dehydrogenase